MVDVAVEAFAIVLPHQFPVRRNHVVGDLRDFRATEPLRREHRRQQRARRGEVRRLAGEADENQSIGLLDAHRMQAVGALVELLHAAAVAKLAVESISPLVIRADEHPRLPARFGGNHRPAMPAHIVMRGQRAVFLADDDRGAGSDLVHKVLAGFANLATVAGEEPAALPEQIEFDVVKRSGRIKSPRQAVTWTVRSDQVAERRKRRRFQ